MRKIVVSEFMTLDGIVEAPDQWSMSYWNDSIAQFKTEEMQEADALLLGRVTYDGFAAAWPAMIDQPGGKEMNGYRKWVVSSTLETAEWSNSVIVRDLVDAYRLLVYPVVLGRGKRLFGTDARTNLELVDARDVGSGVTALRYQRKADAD